MRNRIVARQFANELNPEFYAGAPPTWALKMILSRCASIGRRRHIALHDISVAFLHAKLSQPIWARPPPELQCDGWMW